MLKPNINILLFFLIQIRQFTVIAKKHRHSPWIYKKTGDVIVNCIFPLQTHVEGKLKVNIEGVLWLGAFVDRIQNINERKLLHDNFTVGYKIYESGNDVSRGLKHTLSLLNEVVNQQERHNGPVITPVVIGPSLDKLEDVSKNMYDLFNVSRLVYTTTSARFGTNEFSKLFRVVPSDVVHVYALEKLVKMTKIDKFCAVVSETHPQWLERLRMFKSRLIQIKSKKIIHVISATTIDNGTDISNDFFSTCEAVILFTKTTVSHRIIQNIKKFRLKIASSDLWLIEVCQFDDPLLRVYDSKANLTKLVIVRNKMTDDVDHYRKKLLHVLNESDELVRPYWLRNIYQKYCKTSRSFIDKKGDSCKNFLQRIKSEIGRRHKNLRSTLTLQGIFNSVDLVTDIIGKRFQDCDKLQYRQKCLKILPSEFTEKLRNKISSLKWGLSSNNFRVQYLVKMHKEGAYVFGMNHSWTITTQLLSSYGKIAKVPLGLPDIRLINTSNINKSSTAYNQTCNNCGETKYSSECVSNKVIISWKSHWAIVLYFLQGICLILILGNFTYFFLHKNSPITILCYSWLDNIILAVLCLFCLLPLMHLGELSANRCMMFWSMLNLCFAFYAGLLLTKTLVIQNILRCEVATDKPARRLIFAASILVIHIVILVILMTVNFQSSICSSRRETTAVCNIQWNASILTSLLFNWLTISALFVLTLVETVKEQKNFCRTENLIIVVTVQWVSYTFTIMFGFFVEEINQHVLVAFVYSIIYLVNVAVCLVVIYVPTLRLVSTWLQQHTRQQRNLTSITHAQVMSSKRKSSGPIRDSLFGMNLTVEHIRSSGYYFDLRPTSAAIDMSCPTLQVQNSQEQTHKVYGHSRKSKMSLNDFPRVDSVPSVDYLKGPSTSQSVNSIYDNISLAAEAENVVEHLPQELLYETSTYWERDESNESNDFVGIYEENINTNKWPSFEKLRASDL